MNKRIITLNLDFDRLTGGSEVIKAIGYFSTWAYNSYNKVSIYHDGEQGLIAQYSREGSDKIGYVIGAVWDDKTQTYSFHS